MITYRKLAQNEIQFIAFCGITIFEFDLLEQAIRVEISRMRRGKERRPGGGRTPKLELREQMLVALNYMRTYTVQEAIAASFGIKQYDVSRIITKLSGPLIRCLPHPKKVFDMVKLAATMEEAEQLIPGLQVLVDASEQQTQRPKEQRAAEEVLFRQGPPTHLQGSSTRGCKTACCCIKPNTFLAA